MKGVSPSMFFLLSREKRVAGESMRTGTSSSRQALAPDGEGEEEEEGEPSLSPSSLVQETGSA